MRGLTLTFILSAAIATAAYGNIIHVPGDQPTIQAGIDAAAPGDTVLVAPGTYVGPGNRNLACGGKALLLRSSAGAAATVLDCQQAGRGFVFESSETPATGVEGFTVRNGLTSLGFGGALIASSSAPRVQDCVFSGNRANTGGALFVSGFTGTISRCTFTGNTADNGGGAIYGESSTLTLTDCTLNGNAAGFGAGIHLAFSSTAILTRCSFNGNAAANLAGALYASGGSHVLAHCTFEANVAGNRGGALCCNDGASASLDSCTFVQNSTHVRGGAVYGEDMQSLTLNSCRFADNAAEPGLSGLKGGGALFLRPIATFSATDCEFTGNQAQGLSPMYGGAIYSGATEAETFTRCTFSRNSANDVGGAIDTGEGALFTDCIFMDNEAGGPGGAVSGTASFLRCQFARNRARDGGALANGSAEVSIADCTFTDNVATEEGGAINWNTGDTGLLSLERCVFSRNSGLSGGALYVATFGDLPQLIAECVFEENSALYGGVIRILSGYGHRPSITISHSTFAKNAGSYGGSLSLGFPIAIENSIFAVGTAGEAIRCEGQPPVLSCTDIFGNAGGDWIGCIADQLGINGCLSADPLFCNAAAGDYTLAETSPCAPAHSPSGCDLIGARPVACVTPIGVDEQAPPAAGLSLSVVPNPITRDAVVEIAGGRRVVRLSLHDVAGRLAARRDVRVDDGATRRVRWSDLLGGGELPAGIYFLEVTPDGGGVSRARTRVAVVK
jgi:predicted outer membrane repeat protein